MSDDIRGEYIYEYPRPMVTVDCAIFRNLNEGPEVLLIVRKNDPFQGKLALPGGFLDMEEEIADGALRELREETGLAGVEVVQMGTYGTPGRDPRGRTVSVVYVGVAPEDAIVAGGDDAAEALWVDCRQFEWDREHKVELAFDHGMILKDALDWLRNHYSANNSPRS